MDIRCCNQWDGVKAKDWAQLRVELPHMSRSQRRVTNSVRNPSLLPLLLLSFGFAAILLACLLLTGVGAKKTTSDNWLENSSAFDSLLKSLNQNIAPAEGLLRLLI